MKTTKYIASAIASMALAACSQEINPVVNETIDVEKNPNLVEITLTANSEVNEDDTKATFINYPKLGWEKGDKVSILGLLTGNEMFTADSRGNVSTFTGEADPNDALYYGLYPYDENVTITEDGVFENVIIPAVQTATAGSFDPKAYVAIAKSEDKENLYFKGLGTFLKFNIKAFAGMSPIKTITVTGNNNEVLAGKAAVTKFNDDGGTAHSNLSGSDAAYSVTLEGTFDTEKAYFMMVRPQPYSKGITVQVELQDGTLLKRSGSKQLFATGEARNSILTLVLDPKHFTEPDPYTYYNMGRDITVGDKVYSKSVNGNATKITATVANTNIYNQLKNGGIYFLETSGEGSFCLDSHVDVKNDVVLIGNVNSGKVLVNMNVKNVNHTAKTVALKNLELDTKGYTNYVFANNNATADADAFVLDNCSVTGLVKPLWYVNVAGYTLKNLYLVDTDIALAAGTNIIDLGKTTSLGNENVTIKNCIIYGASNYVSRIVNNSQNLSAYTADVAFENNTVYSLHAGTGNGLLHMAGASSVVFKNNLINFYSLNATEYIIRIWKNTLSYTVENNHFWARAASGIPADLTFYSNVKVEAAAANITSGAYPFTSTVPGAGATR